MRVLRTTACLVPRHSGKPTLRARHVASKESHVPNGPACMHDTCRKQETAGTARPYVGTRPVCTALYYCLPGSGCLDIGWVQAEPFTRSHIGTYEVPCSQQSSRNYSSAVKYPKIVPWLMHACMHVHMRALPSKMYWTKGRARAPAICKNIHARMQQAAPGASPSGQWRRWPMAPPLQIQEKGARRPNHALCRRVCLAPRTSPACSLPHA